MSRIKKTGEETIVEYTTCSNDKDVEIHAFPIHDANGAVTMIVEYIEDVTEKKQIQKTLIENEIKYRKLFESTHEAVMILDNSGFIDCNDATLRMFGCPSRDEFCKLHPSDISPAVQPDGQNSKTLSNQQISIAISERHNHFEWVHKRMDGEEFRATVSLSVMDYNGKRVVQALVRDITDRHNAEIEINHRLNIESALARVAQKLALSSDKNLDKVMKILGEAMEVNRAYIFKLNRDGKTISNTSEWCSPGVSAQKSDIQNMNIDDCPLWTTFIRARENIVITDVKALPPEAKSVKEMLQAQGVRALLVVPFFSLSGHPSGFMGFDDTEGPRNWSDHDVEVLKVAARLVSFEWERGEADRILSRTISQYTAMINTVPAKMYLKDINYKYVFVNDAFCTATGKDRNQVVGKTDYDIYPSDTANLHHESDKTVMDDDQGIISREEHIVDADGNNKWVSTTKIPIHDKKGSVTGIVGLVQDITEQYQSRERLAQSDKLAAIGTLAAGVAHEINNPIGFISSNLNTMKKYVDKISSFIATIENENASDRKKIDFILEDFTDAIEESIEGTTRVRNIVADLKSFSRVDKAEKGQANLNEGIESTLNIVWNELKYKCKVEKKLGDIPDLYCIPNQLNQVFLNILVNAGHAIEHNEGLIKIESKATDKDIIISFTDNGKGIPKANIKKLFEPFFTTKEVGKGTGLGLSLAYDIVKKHGGHIDVKSEVGEGTEFTISLPLEGISDD
ncbi:MAG: hypothetical protein DRP47_01205 [Candidatus Zixiibacteriota bacterium]|nr:MAG: hypothetical protein DRP47_01205 [candidate division Zixibacteria bacterium]